MSSSVAVFIADFSKKPLLMMQLIWKATIYIKQVIKAEVGMQPFILKIHAMVCAQAIENAQLRNLTFRPCTIIPRLCRSSFSLLLVIVISDNHEKWVNGVHEYMCMCTRVLMHVEVRGQCQVSSSMNISLDLELAHWLEYLAGEYQETSCIALIPNTEISVSSAITHFGWRC